MKTIYLFGSERVNKYVRPFLSTHGKTFMNITKREIATTLKGNTLFVIAVTATTPSPANLFYSIIDSYYGRIHRSFNAGEFRPCLFGK